MTNASPLLPFTPTSPVICVGPRRPEKRRSVKLGLFTLGLTVCAFNAAIAYKEPINGWVGRTIAQVETRAVHERIPGTFSGGVAFTSLLNAEDAWSMGNPQSAAQQWFIHLDQPGGDQDLQVAGWALRAAVKADQPALVLTAVNRWNQVRRALPSDIRASVPVLKSTPAGPGLYDQLVQAGHGQAETYDAWLDRAPLAAEIVATKRQCDLAAGCTAPLPVAWKTIDEQAAAQIRIWKNRGFTPQMAWDLYRERQMLGDADHEISSRHHHRLSEIEQLRLVMQQRLARVQTPADLPAYWAAWKDQPDHFGVNLMWEGQAGVLGGLWGLQVDWDRRLSGHDSGWSSFGTPVDAYQWERLQNMVSLHLQAQPVGEVPDGLTATEADKRLLQAVQHAGLRQLRWPTVFPATPAVKWRLAGLIDQGNQTLQHATGWEGPVLGQAGHVVLALSAVAAGNQEGMETAIPSKDPTQHNVIISTVMGGDSLGEIPHEWFHAHDSLLALHRPTSQPNWASNQVAADLDMPIKTLWMLAGPHSSTNGPEHAMANLWESVRSPELTIAQHMDAILEGWVGQWTARQPQYRDQWLADAADVRQHRWTIERSQARWGDNGRPKSAETELFTLVEQSRHAPRFQSEQVDLSTSPWVQASRSAGAQAEDTARPNAKDEASYWSLPTEMLARSFGRQLADQPVVSGRIESAWIYYPQGAEKAWQEPVWKRYFQEQKGWWNQLRAEAVARPLGRTLGQATRSSGASTSSP